MKQTMTDVHSWLLHTDKLGKVDPCLKDLLVDLIVVLIKEGRVPALTKHSMLEPSCLAAAEGTSP